MASFQQTIITDLGKKLMAKIAVGEQLVFTKIRLSDAEVLDENLPLLEELASPRQETDIESIEIINEDTVKIKGIIENTNISNGYFIKLIALFAQNPDGGEILYAVSKAIHADFMPAFNGVTTSKLAINILMAVSNADNVELTINPAALATLADIDYLDTKIIQANQNLSDHENLKIYREEGAHGLRYFEDELKYWNGFEWAAVILPEIPEIPEEPEEPEPPDPGDTTDPPANVTSFTITPDDLKLIIKWTDPSDTGNSTWNGTMLRRKTGGYPTDENDGILVKNSQVRNQYSVNGYEDSGLTAGTTYYYQLFPYSDTGKVNTNIANRNSGVPIQYFAPANVSGLGIIVGNGNLTIKWSDPANAQYATWSGTKLIRKAGSYPSTVTDGVQVVDNKVRNQYSSSGFVDSGLTNGTKYYYQAFPYSDKNKVNTNTANRITGTPVAPPIYGVSIDSTNSNPTSAVTYTDDAVGKSSGSSWDSVDLFQMIKPCVLKDNGEVNYYLNPNNYTLKANGGSADLSGADGQVMIEFPNFKYAIKYSGNYLTVRVSPSKDVSISSGQKVHSYGNKFYVGAYEATDKNARLCSVVDQYDPYECENSKSSLRTLANNRGSGWHIISHRILTALQCLFILRNKTLDSRTNKISRNTSNGVANTKGMNTGDFEKFLGIENLWRAYDTFIDGIYVKNNGDVVTKPHPPFNDENAYNKILALNNEIYSDFPKKAQGKIDGGFFPEALGASSSTYYCGYADLYGFNSDFAITIASSGYPSFFHLGGIEKGVGLNASTRLIYLPTSD